LGAIVKFAVYNRVPGEGDAINRLLEPGLRQTLEPVQITRLADAVAAGVHNAYLVVLLVACLLLLLAALYPAGLGPTRSSKT
jgi:hypothetical protein